MSCFCRAAANYACTKYCKVQADESKATFRLQAKVAKIRFFWGGQGPRSVFFGHVWTRSDLDHFYMWSWSDPEQIFFQCVPGVKKVKRIWCDFYITLYWHLSQLAVHINLPQLLASSVNPHTPLCWICYQSTAKCQNLSGFLFLHSFPPQHLLRYFPPSIAHTVINVKMLISSMFPVQQCAAPDNIVVHI